MTIRTARPIFSSNLSTDGVRRIIGSYHKSANGAVVDDFKLKPGFLYTQVRAISARVNQNYDGWPSTELKKSYKTFLGKPVFVNHQNFDPSKARGRVVASRYVESGNDKYIEVIQEIDAQRFPKLASEIRSGGLDSVSMGVEAGFTKCSVCDNKATDLHDMCSHVKYHKGEYLPHAKTGKRTLVFENCYKLGFFELSYVFDPADETAVVSKVLVANKRKQAAGFDSGWSANDPNIYGDDPEEVDEEIPDEPGGFANGWESFKGRKLDPNAEVYTHLNLHAVRQGLPGIWSFSQAQHVPDEDGNLQKKHLVVGYAPEAHLSNARMHVQKGAARKYYEAMQAHLADPENVPAPSRTVHAGIKGYLAQPPREALPYSGIEYHPGDVYGQFVHRDNKEPIDTADLVHLSPDKRAYAHQGDNWGRDHEPQLVVDAHPGVNASNRHTVWPPQTKKAKMREASINAQYFSGPGVAFSWGKKYAYGELEAPEDVDTLRNSDEDEDRFHHYVKSPQELRTPNMDNAIQLDRQQEEEGLDNKRRAEDVEDLSPHDTGKKIVEPDAAHESVIDDFLDWCDSINIAPSQDALDDFSNSYHLNNEDYQAVSDFLESEDNGAGPTSNANQPVPRMSRRKMATYRYAEESLPPWLQDSEGEEAEGYGDEGGYGEDEDFDPDYDGDEDNEADEDWDEDYAGGDDYADVDGDGDHDDDDHHAEEGMYDDDDVHYDDVATDPSLSDVAAETGLAIDVNDEGGIEIHQAYRNNGKSRTSSQKKRRAQKGKSMARETLASRGKKAASRQRLHRLANDNGHFDGGPYDENNQGEQEDIFLSQTPGEEGLAAPVPGDGTISNTENTLVARIQQKKDSLARDILAWNEIQRHKIAADGGIPDADTVNPELSGTDDQSLKGQDFERVQPDKVETQSKDASLKAFAAFDHWLRSTTGRTAAQHGNANFVRRQATRWAGTYGYPVEVLFPALGTFLREARRIEGGNMRRTADEKLEVAAPQDRIDVEAPVSNVTDADAQASQFDLSDFGGNASDNVADPDLNTDSQIWAPGEGVKESNRKADGVAAIRLAEAYIKAGLKPEGEKYNLVAQFQTMRHATVTDRTRLLEAVLKTAAFSRRVTAGTNRGAAPRTPIPPGLMNGGGMSRSASVNRVAANDPSTDSDLFL